MAKYNVVYGEDCDSWLTDADCVEDVIKEYKEQDIGGGQPISYIYEMNDVTPKDIASISAGPDHASTIVIAECDGLPAWWSKPE